MASSRGDLKDAGELLAWVSAVPRRVREVFLVQGEPAQSGALRHSIGDRKRVRATVAEDRRTVVLD